MKTPLPGRCHSTWIDPASDYAEIFLVLDRATALQLLALGLISSAEVLTVACRAEALEAFAALRREMQRSETELPTRAALACVINFLKRSYSFSPGRTCFPTATRRAMAPTAMVV